MEGGPPWLDRLPSLVHDLVGRWEFTVGTPFTGGLNSWVAPVTRTDGVPAVLKITLPHDEARHEADALLAWGGRGAVEVFDRDVEAWAVLIERCDPGTSLNDAGLGDDEAAEVLAGLLTQLWEAPLDGPFADLAVEMAGQHEGLVKLEHRFPGTVDPDLLRRAAACFAAGPDPTGRRVLLHRDLHGANILLSARGWLAIDPKPFLGDAVADLCQPLAADLPSAGQVPRLARLLGVDAAQVRERTLALCVIESLWNRSIGRDAEARTLADRATAFA